jgi:hypothetical protein
MAPAFTSEAYLQRGSLTAEQRDEQLIGRVFGNLHIERPEITREQVAAMLRKANLTEVQNVTRR